jgi:glyoxylase-like metal-dependent hydrolase (beta-lactamase superfamily II)
MHVFERGWLSSNNILCINSVDASLIDTGYATHAPQTVAMMAASLQGRELRQIACTHLHSDHCGGVAALQTQYAGVKVWIPPGESELIALWDEDALSYLATGQECPRFTFDALLQPGTHWAAGGFDWRVLAAPGHDPHSVVLYEPEHRVLISADALWEHGFGVVFPAIDGIDAFDEVEQTLNLLDDLDVQTVIPGHGRVFSDFRGAITRARARLRAFRADPRKHALHAGKVLVKFKLLERQSMNVQELLRWIEKTPNFVQLRRHHFPNTQPAEFAMSLVDGLVKVGAATRGADFVMNAEPH